MPRHVCTAANHEDSCGEGVLEMQKRVTREPLSILSREHIYFAAGAIGCELRRGYRDR
jgi:hypothetical protein